jgi:hypothetical protein
VDSDRGEGLGYGGRDPEELGVQARRIWEGEHWRHFPEGLHIWDLRPFMGSMEKIVKISEDIKIKSALWKPF